MDEVQAPALMTQAEYARHRDCSRQYVSRLAREGRLVLRDDLVDALESDRILGPPGAEDEDEVLSGTDRSRAELRLIEAQAALTELKLRERAGELVEAAGVAQKVSDVVAPLFDRLEALPMSVAEKLTRLNTEREIAVVIAAAIEDVRAAFAQDVEKSLAVTGQPDVVQDAAGEPHENREGDGGGAGQAAAADDAE
jgi:phage terminase Nu1 subunit (DNA packaging protein)